MSKILAVGGPKGGVGKTTVALNLATSCARRLGLSVLLVDADPNRSATDAALAAGDAMPFDVVGDAQPHQLPGLRASGYDLVVVDLPGVRASPVFDALLGGDRGTPLADGLVFPTRPELMDLRPLLSLLDTAIRPRGIDYLIALVRVHRDRTATANRRREELRGLGYRVADAHTRALLSHDDALERGVALCDLPGGRHSAAAAADREYRALTAELLTLTTLDPAPLTA